METAYMVLVRSFEETGVASALPHYANKSLAPWTLQALSSH